MEQRPKHGFFDRAAWLCILLLLAILLSPVVGCAGARTGRAKDSGANGSQAAEERPDRAPTPAGYTKLSPSKDTRFIYVSSSSGNDNNSGLSSRAPVASVERGIELLRDGKPDWLLFRRGDTFNGGLGQWVKQGRSKEEPMVVWSYGTSTKRPLFRTLDDDGMWTGGSGAPTVISHLVLMGLHFYASLRDPTAPGFQPDLDSGGIAWLSGTRDLLIEDCLFSHYALAVGIQNYEKAGISKVRLRKNLFLDQWHQRLSQGVYLWGVDGILIEGNVFDHTGANKLAGAEPNIFSHDLYIDNGNTGVVVRDNIFMRATSHGMQLRPGGIASGNLFARNAISLLLGGGDHPEPGGIEATAADNVILEGTNISPAEQRGWGIDLQNIRHAEVTGNIIAHLAERSENVMALDTDENAEASGNIVYKWGPGKSSPGPFVDPERSLARYNATQGGPESFEGFVNAVRGISRLTPKPAYTASAINAWIRAGFARP